MKPLDELAQACAALAVATRAAMEAHRARLDAHSALITGLCVGQALLAAIVVVEAVVLFLGTGRP